MVADPFSLSQWPQHFRHCLIVFFVINLEAVALLCLIKSFDCSYSLSWGVTHSLIPLNKSHDNKVVIGKMFGSRHPPAPIILFKFSRNFVTEGRAFLKWLSNIFDDADATHIFKDKGKLSRIMKNYPIIAHATFLFFFEM